MLFRQGTDSRRSAVLYVSQVGPVICTVISVLWPCSSDQVKIYLKCMPPKICNILIIQLQILKKRLWHNFKLNILIYFRKKQHQSEQNCFGGDRLLVVPMMWGESAHCTLPKLWLEWSVVTNMWPAVTRWRWAHGHGDIWAQLWHIQQLVSCVVSHMIHHD